MGVMQEWAEKLGLEIREGKRGSIIIYFPSERMEITLSQKKAWKLLLFMHLRLEECEKNQKEVN
jgi:hypothetical protein